MSEPTINDTSEIDWDHCREVSSNYLGFSGTLAGLTFTAYYFYLDNADFNNIFVLITSFLLLTTSVMFLLATISYADCSKIHKDTIKYRKVGEKEFHSRKVSWEKTIHLADMLTLFGFIIMLLAISFGIMVFDTIIGIASAIIIWTMFLFYMVKSEAHG